LSLILNITSFYIVLIVLLTLAGISIQSDAEDIIEFPSFPTIPSQQSFVTKLGGFGTLLTIPLLVAEFLIFVLLIIGFLIQMISFNLLGVLPWWLNTILFLPLIITIFFEFITKVIRGSG